MKIRRGFVSNSSSSSFTCEICGSEEGGYDMCMSDAGMCRCDHGHLMCESHRDEHMRELAKEGLEAIRAKLAIDDMNEDVKQFNEIVEETALTSEQKETDLTADELYDCMTEMELRSDFPAAFCPICQLTEIIDSDVLNYLLVRMNRTAGDIRKEIQDTYGDRPKDFQNFLKRGS